MARSFIPKLELSVDEQIALRDPAFVQQACETAARTIVRYHRGELEGVERVPSGPALYVGNHNSSWWTPDTWVLSAALWRYGGLSLMPFGLGHDIVLQFPGLRTMFSRLGTVPAHPDNARRLFELGHKALVYPGGDLDSMRPFRKRNEITFGGRQGYIRLALTSDVPIVPVVAQGAHGAMLIIDDLQWLAKAVGADKRLRLKVLPLIFTVPFGLSIGMAPPFIPFPVKIRMSLLPPIRFDRHGPEAAADAAYVAACAAQVETAMQTELTRLAALP